METHKRSIAKTISFRILATIITIILVLIFTGNIALASVIGIVEMITKLIAYYLHERLWDKIAWGIRTR